MNTIETFFDKIFVIHLTRRLDRWDECVAELDRHGISYESVEWFEAFDHPTNGHIGCSRSHRALIRKIANSDWDRVLVLEDDFQIITLPMLRQAGFKPTQDVWKTFCSVLDGSGTFQERFDYLSGFIPDQFDVLYLGAGYGEPPISRLNEHVIRCGFMQTTSSYGITREFAKIWDEKVNASMGSDDLEKHPGQNDNTFGGMSHDHLFYVLQPRLMCQRLSKSDLDGGTNSRLGQMTDPAHENMV